MYSENDFRYYQGGALSHAEGEKKKWNWLPGGKNPPEYNAWYYATHPEKWGITKAAKDVYNKAKDLADKTEFTDLDDRALDALGRGANRVKEGLKNNSVVSDTRRSTEALQRRDTAERKAAQARDNASRATSSRTADMYEREAQKYDRQAAQESANARGYGNRAKNTVSRGVRNTVENAGRSARGLGQRALNATTIDEKLGTAARSLRSGNFGGARVAASSAAKEAGRRLGEAGGKAVGAVRDAGRRALDATTIDEKLGTAARSLASGNLGGARVAAKSAAKEAGSRLRSAGQRVLDSTDLDDRAIDFGRNAVDAARGAARTVGNATGYNQRQTARRAQERADAAQREINEREASGRTVSGEQRDRAARLQADANIAQNRYNRTALGRAESAVRNAPGNARAAVESIPGRLRDAGQRALDATTIDEKLGTAARSLRSGNVKGAGIAAKSAAKEAGRRLLGAANDVYDSVNDAGRRLDKTVDDAIGVTARRDLENAQKEEGLLRDIYNNASREASDRRNSIARDINSGRGTNALDLSTFESNNDAATDARSRLPEAQKKTREAQERYSNSLMGRIDSASSKTAEEAQRMARKEVRDAMSEYWDAVDKYGVGSDEAIRAARKAQSNLNNTERRLINNFGNAKNTIEDVIGNGMEWLDNLIPDFKTKK